MFEYSVSCYMELIMYKQVYLQSLLDGFVTSASVKKEIPKREEYSQCSVIFFTRITSGLKSKSWSPASLLVNIPQNRCRKCRLKNHEIIFHLICCKIDLFFSMWLCLSFVFLVVFFLTFGIFFLPFAFCLNVSVLMIHVFCFFALWSLGTSFLLSSISQFLSLSLQLD